ncbi:hypothetical protein D9M68_358940 [compost metagenome]
MADWIELDERALRQYIDAKQTFEAYEAACRQVQSVSGGMLWRRSKGHEYLIQTSKDNRQRSLGRKSAETEAQYAQFTARKRAAQERLRTVRHQMAIHHQLNRGLRVGHVPALLVRILAALERLGLHDDVLVAGEAALFAYETQAGVRLCEPASPASQDGPGRLSLQIWVASHAVRELAFTALRAADKSFIARHVHADGLEAGNAQGWTVAIRDTTASAAVIASASPLAMSKFSIPVVSETGRMARLTTIPPCLYVACEISQAARNDLPPALRAWHDARAHAVLRLVEMCFPN